MDAAAGMVMRPHSARPPPAAPAALAPRAASPAGAAAALRGREVVISCKVQDCGKARAWPPNSDAQSGRPARSPKTGPQTQPQTQPSAAGITSPPPRHALLTAHRASPERLPIAPPTMVCSSSSTGALFPGSEVHFGFGGVHFSSDRGCGCGPLCCRSKGAISPRSGYGCDPPSTLSRPAGNRGAGRVATSLAS
jgi:hypothetical protein